MTSLFPTCGADCEHQKQLDALKTAMDNASPANAQKAKTDYYTALNGQGWLQEQKQQVASQQVEPVLRKLRAQYDALVAQSNSQSQFSNLASAIKSDGGTPLLLQDYKAEKSKADVMDRMAVLTNPWQSPEGSIDWFGYLLTALILLVVLVIVFVMYRKYSKTVPPPVAVSGGNRLRK
jgi:hypothetical protein